MNNENSKVQLNEKGSFLKVLGTKEIFALSLGIGSCSSTWGSALIGVGEYGSSFLLATIVAAVLYLLIASNYAELASSFPKSASIQTYVEKAFNPTMGKVGAIVFTLCFLIGGSGEVIFASHILSAGFPNIPWQVWAVAMTTVFGLIINLIGISKVGDWANYLVYFIIAVALLVTFQGLTGIAIVEPDMSRLTSIFESFDTMGFFSAFLLAMWMYAGFEVVCPLAEECKKPEKDLPIGMFSAIGVMGGLKILFTIGSLVLVSPHLLVGENSFSALGNAMLGKTGIYIMMLFVLTACCATVLSNSSATSRMLYGMSRGSQNLMPKALDYLHPKFRTPWKTQFLYWALMNTLILGFGQSMTFLMLVGSFVWIVQYVLILITNLVVRKKHPNLERPYKVPGPFKRSPIITWIALIGILIFLTLSVVPPIGDPQILYVGGTALVIVIAYAVIQQKVHNKKEIGK